MPVAPLRAIATRRPLAGEPQVFPSSIGASTNVAEATKAADGNAETAWTNGASDPQPAVVFVFDQPYTFSRIRVKVAPNMTFGFYYPTDMTGGVQNSANWKLASFFGDKGFNAGSLSFSELNITGAPATQYLYLGFEPGAKNAAVYEVEFYGTPART